MDEHHLKDFLSTRSPVFKSRPLPETKAEAIDLMLEQPNLIRRPLLLAGRSAIFGFDRARYDALARGAGR